MHAREQTRERTSVGWVANNKQRGERESIKDEYWIGMTIIYSFMIIFFRASGAMRDCERRSSTLSEDPGGGRGGSQSDMSLQVTSR